jgi:hypothetical protein
MKGIFLGLLVLLSWAVPAAVKAQSGDGYDYTVNTDDTNTITITGYKGADGAVTIPTNINGFLVTCIGNGETPVFDNFGLTSVTIPGSVTDITDGAFAECFDLSSVTMANGITNIGEYAFYECSLSTVTIPGSVSGIGNAAFENCDGLRSFYFMGNAPAVDPDAFAGDAATVFYLPGTTGWSIKLAGLLTVLWNPLIQVEDESFGVQSNQFGFNITGTTNIPIVVEACSDLASSVWLPLQTFAMTNGLVYFSDPQWTNYPARYYRVSSP